MITSYFETKVKYIKISEDGRERKVNELYLLDAMTYTEAESRIIKEMETMVQGDYYITSLKKSNVSEVVLSEDENDDHWYKVKVSFDDHDDSGKVKKYNQYYLVTACDTKKAQELLEEYLSVSLLSYDIVSISDTMFLDIFS